MYFKVTRCSWEARYYYLCPESGQHFNILIIKADNASQASHHAFKYIGVTITETNDNTYTIEKVGKNELEYSSSDLYVDISECVLKPRTRRIILTKEK